MERPIIFSTEMVQAILENRKTMTRRIVKPQPEHNGNKHWILRSPKATLFSPVPPNEVQFDDYLNGTLCSYGMIGDVLWVRETFQYNADFMSRRIVPYFYKTDKINIPIWKPSIFMPKAAARIWLEITDVRVDSLWDISLQDIEAEGLPVNWRDTCSSPLEWFQSLWQKINGAEFWDANHWVWVISFKVLSTTGLRQAQQAANHNQCQQMPIK